MFFPRAVLSRHNSYFPCMCSSLVCSNKVVFLFKKANYDINPTHMSTLLLYAKNPHALGEGGKEWYLFRGCLSRVPQVTGYLTGWDL